MAATNEDVTKIDYTFIAIMNRLNDVWTASPVIYTIPDSKFVPAIWLSPENSMQPESSTQADDKGHNGLLSPPTTNPKAMDDYPTCFYKMEFPGVAPVLVWEVDLLVWLSRCNQFFNT